MSPVRVPDLFKTGLIQAGDEVYTKKCPEAVATVVDAKTVEYDGERMTYNEWGVQVTGWASINIYPQVVLARTGQTFDDLRDVLCKQGKQKRKAPSKPKRRGYRRSG